MDWWVFLRVAGLLVLAIAFSSIIPLGYAILYCWGLYRDAQYRKNYYYPYATQPPQKDLDAIALRRRDLNARPTLPTVRPRALTLTRQPEEGPRGITDQASEIERPEQITHDQVESSILYTLPVEIRSIIWRYAFTGSHIHIARRRRRLGYAICPNPDIVAEGGKDLCTELRDCNDFWVPTNYPPRASPLSLAKTCRQIYSETIDMVYAENTFAFVDPYAFIWFQSSVLPSRMQLLRSIDLSWDFHSLRPWQPNEYRLANMNTPYERETWILIISKLAALPQLRDLRVFIVSKLWSHLPIARGDIGVPEVLSTMVDVKPQRTFQVWLPSSYPVQIKMDEIHAFTLHRPPWNASDIAALVTPFDARCLHCGDGTVVSRGIQTHAERCIIASDAVLPGEEEDYPELELYRVRHGKCGGLIEYETDSDSWRVSHGAERLA